jgi:ribosomal protein S18 acetylase RimI-like enzyme
MVIRIATADEAPTVAGIVNSAFAVERDFRPGDRISAAEIVKLIDRDLFLVAEQNGRIAAAVHVSVAKEIGYFGMLAVDRQVQGAGLGRRLLEAAEDHCRKAGCVKMTLSTGEERTELVAWYERLGYRVTSAAVSDNPAFNRPIRVVQMSKPL